MKPYSWRNSQPILHRIKTLPPVKGRPGLLPLHFLACALFIQCMYVWVEIVHDIRTVAFAGIRDCATTCPNQVVCRFEVCIKTGFNSVVFYQAVLNALAFVAELWYVKKLFATKAELCGEFASNMLFAHAILVYVFIGLPEGHDYFLPTIMGSMEAMQLTNKHGLPKMKRIALVSILALGSLYVVYVDTEQMPVWCAKYHLVGSPWRGPMTTFLQVCKPSYQRQVHFLLSSSLYVMYILGKFEEGIGFNVMGQLWKKDLDDFLNGQFVSEVNKSAIEATQAIVEPKSEGLLGSEGSSLGSPARSKYSLDNLDRTPFNHFSSSGYTPEEIQAVTKVMSLFKEANMEDLNWPEPGNLFHEELNVQLPSEKKSRGKMVGKAIGYVNECPSMIASWCWDYCSDARRAFNHKFDIKRETVSRDSDHSMTIFQQKWFPKPHLHRDFLFKQIWKRLDDHTIIVIYYDDTNSFFNESFFQHRQKEQKTKRAYISNILVLQELLELEDEDGNKFKPSTVMTKVSQLCILDLNGDIDDSLSLTNLRSALSTIKEMQDFFPNEDASSNIRMRSESVDTDLDEAVNDEKEINWDSYQLLQQDADNIDNYLRKVYADVGDVAASEFTDDVEGHAAKSTRAEEAANKFQIGAFSMWAIENCPDEITMPFSAEDKSSDDPNISSFTKSLPKLKSERKNLFKTSEFDDPVIEAEYFEYYIISNRAGIIKIVWILKVYAIVMIVVMPAFLADQGHSQSLVAMLIMWFMSMLLAFFNQKLLTSLKRGLVSNNSFHVVSGIILVLCLVADSQLINAKIFQTGFSHLDPVTLRLEEPSHSWDFRGCSTNSPVTDSIGGGLPFTPLNGPTCDATGINLDGNNDYLEGEPYSFGGTMSIEVYVKYDSFNDHSRVFDFSNGHPSDNVQLINVGTTSTISWVVWQGTSTIKFLETSNFDSSTWTHVVATVSGTNMKIYKNGVLAGTKTDGHEPNVLTRSQHIIGAAAFGSYGYFNGTIAYVRMWHGEELQQSDVTSLYSHRNSQGETSSENPTIDIKYHLFIFWFITFQSLTFYLLTTRVEARIGQTHQLFHLIESLARLVMMMGVRVYRLFLYRFFGPVTCIILCMYCTTIRETQFRSTFSVIYARLYEKFSYRLDSLASVLQEAMSLPDEKVEEIQVAIRQHGVGGNANVIGFGCKQIPIEEVEYEKKIGQGSESIVYLARHRNKIVAVKQISISNLNRRSVGSMLSEIKLLADLSHNNIIQLHAAIIPGPETEIQVVGMVLEHAKEGTVSSFLKCHESLDWQDYKRNIALGISKGMKYLHSRRQPIVHRDLKTTNCLLTEWREVKVADFGASRFYKEGVMTSVVGSKYFMSPEMLCGDRYDVKTDVYSFGSLLADIGMGGNIQRLFLNRDDGPRSMDYNKFMIEGWRPSLPEAWVEEMPTITDLINRCWSHDPNDRPSFAEIKMTLAKWSGKLSRTMRESAVLRASTEYTKEDLEFINDGLRDFNLLSLPPANHKPQDGEPRTNFAYSSLKDNTWRVHLELSINFPSWEVMDYILDWDNPERCAANRLLGETSNSVLHLENEHSKIVETILLTSKTKIKQYVAKLMWKEISKDNFFCWTKMVKDPRWQNANVQRGGSSLKAGWTVVGHPDGKSCHVVHNSSLHVPLLQSKSYYYDLEKFTNRCKRQLHDIAAILKKRKVMKAIEMQKLYDRKIRYQANDYMQENIVMSTNTTNSQDEEVRSVNNNEINSDMPWVSRTAMDQDYRTWRRDNRKITGVGTDGQRNNLPRVGQRSRSRNALNRSNQNMDQIAEDGDERK